MQVAIIGGGAAGFFAAISCKQHHPSATVTIYEKSGKLLSKVKVSGGGRCNVTHACYSVPALSKHYPRGEKQLKKALGYFSVKDTERWFTSRGVKLKTEADNRIFPVTDNSQTIIDCLMDAAKSAGVTIQTHQPILKVAQAHGQFQLSFKGGGVHKVDRLVIATGGSPKLSGFDWLSPLGHTVSPPVPSLFTFNMPGNPIGKLMGVSSPEVIAKVQGTKLQQRGPLLITHWGMSGPAILKLSAWGARVLADMDYQFTLQVNWLAQKNEENARETLKTHAEQISKRQLGNRNPFGLSARLWEFLIEHKVGLDPKAMWGALSKKSLNRLLNTLLNDEYQVKGKTTFKEEFVTCGGIALPEVDFTTMQSRLVPGLYFAGEVLDVDGITGGFNFQAAWATGFIAGQLLTEKPK